MKKNFSRAQISIFIIISIIIVIVAILFFALNSDYISIFSNDKSSYKVKEYVEECLFLETREAVKQIGDHGGWLYYPQMLFTDRSKPDVFNRRAAGLDFLEQVKIPYWFYFDDSDEEFVINIPDYDSSSEYSLKNQVKKYLEENLDNKCIQDFKIFDDVYDIDYEPKDIKDKIEVEFDDDEIISSLELPLRIVEKNTNNTEYIDYFQSENENMLRIPYYLARDIVYAEAGSSFIEKRILGMLHPYQTAEDREGLPPFYEYKLKYDFKPWKIPEVQEIIKKVVGVNIGMVQFLNTNYDEVSVPDKLVGSDFVEGFRHMYLKDYLSEHSLIKEDEPKIFRQYSSFKVKPVYEGSFFPSMINIAPSLGNVILLPRPQSIMGLIPLFFTEYVSVYEMTLPIIFEIKSEDDLNGDFVFKLAVESNIDYNTPLAENVAVEYHSSAELSGGDSLICEPPQFVSDYIYVNISDPIANGERRNSDDPLIGVDDAIVMFDCKGLATCYVGQTEINGRSLTKNITQMSFRLPINCNPGTLEFYKFGHKRLVIENVNPGLNGNVSLGEQIMPSKKKLNLKLKLVNYGVSGSSIGSAITEDDNGFLIFTNLEDDELVEVVQFDGGNKDDLTVDLTVGDYSIEGFLIYNKSFTIPEEDYCPDDFMGNLVAGDDCEKVPAITLDSWVRGGVQVDKFTIQTNFLISRDTIVVSLTNFGLPSNYDDLQRSSYAMSDFKGITPRPYFE